MLKTRFCDVIYTHTSGGPLCIVHSGIPYPVGSDIVAKRRFVEERYDWLRRSLMREPRGYMGMVGAFLTPPSQPDTHGGVIWTTGPGYLKGCGHGTIGLAMTMVAQGWVPISGNVTTVRLETVAGVTTAEVGASGERVEWCAVENVPAFPLYRDVAIEVPEIGPLTVDVAFGGNFFGIVEWKHPTIKIGAAQGSRFIAIAHAVKKALHDKVKIKHPIHAHVEGEIDLITFYTHDVTGPGAYVRNIHVSGEGHIARSPGGTALSAMLATFEAKGKIKLGQPVNIEGPLGHQVGYFEGTAVRAVDLAGYRAVIPRIRGTANILGYAKWLLDPTDPVSEGFMIG